MDQIKFFETVIEPSTERLALFGIAHDVHHDGRSFIVTHKISKNVFTNFDSRLSRYLAAVTGVGLPGATVESRIRDVASKRSWAPYPARHAASVPDALALAAGLALGSERGIQVRVGAWMSEEFGPDQDVTVTEDSIDIIRQAMKVCGHIGTIDFLEISGDFNRILARPLGSKMDMVIMDLNRGALSIPTVSEMGGSAWQGPIYGFDKAISQAPAISSFLARARHSVAVAKEEAIHAFREASEERILQFNSALAGRQLSGYRLQSATSLVSRLQAGLGDTLLGLSEAAQMTALDWATQVREIPVLQTPIDDTVTDDKPTRPRLVR
ncbi:MAG: hypothetical protein AAF439_02460 [Pseudomonadota bacterium]